MAHFIRFLSNAQRNMLHIASCASREERINCTHETTPYTNEK